MECRVEYAYKEGTNIKRNYPGGVEVQINEEDFFIYKRCKNFCYDKNSKSYPNISHVSGCF